MSYLDSQQQAATKVQLDWAASTDIVNGLAISSNTWTDIGSNQTFTVDDANSVIEIDVSGYIAVGAIAASGSGNIASRLVIDSGGTPINKPLGGVRASNGDYGNLLAGSDPVIVTGLFIGNHTVKLQAYSSGNAVTAYCQAGTLNPPYSFQIRVLEHKVLPSIFSGPQPTTKVQLDYALASDISGTSVPTSWTDLITNQTFSVDDPNSVIEVDVSGMGFSNASQGITLRVVVDSSGTPINKLVGSSYATFQNCFSGSAPISITGLSAGSHTIKLQGYSMSGTGAFYCRPSSVPNNEFLNIRVLERKQTAALVSNCMVKLAEVIVGAGGQASIQFSNIPQGYRSLQIDWVARSDAASAHVSLAVQFNGDTGANYDFERDMGYSTSTQTFNTLAQTSGEVGQTTGGSGAGYGGDTSVFGSGQIKVPNYTGTTAKKMAFSIGMYGPGTTTDPRTMENAVFWRSTAAITSILLFPASGNFVAGSVCSLYGIL